MIFSVRKNQEKLTEGEDMLNFKLGTKKPILPYGEIVELICGFNFSGFSEEALKQQLAQLKDRPFGKEQLPQAYALLKEVAYRQTKLMLHENQLALAVGLLDGAVLELPTGEGKTLGAVLPMALLGILGHHVQMLVFNDYLAERDYALTAPIYRFCGLSVGVLLAKTPPRERQRLYEADLLYLTAKEAGFDYLRNFLVFEPEDFLTQHLDWALVDEADGILIDEAKTPLVIAGVGESDFAKEWAEMKQVTKALAELDQREQMVDY